MTGGVDQHAPPVRLRLGQRLGRAKREQLGLRRVQIINAKIEVGLLRHLSLRPGGPLVSLDPDEGDDRLARVAEGDEVIAGKEYGQV